MTSELTLLLKSRKLTPLKPAPMTSSAPSTEVSATQSGYDPANNPIKSAPQATYNADDSSKQAAAPPTATTRPATSSKSNKAKLADSTTPTPTTATALAHLKPKAKISESRLVDICRIY
jgi:hypothetical protein